MNDSAPDVAPPAPAAPPDASPATPADASPVTTPATAPVALDVGVGHVLEHVRSKEELPRPPVVEFRQVAKTYNLGRANEFTAIRDVTFVVEDRPDKGEFVCVLGPSGCGKSTILRLIAGLEPQHPPTQGEVLVMGQPVRGPGADRGMVFQDYTSFDHRSVLDNVTFGLECMGVSRKERDDLGRQWIKRVDLNVDKDARKYPHELSGGMRQRVAIARTLILRPRIILMDEPFGALDPQTRLNMQDLLVKLWREVQATVFFITHSIEEAVFLGDRVYMMSNSPGTILEEMEVEPPDRPAHEMLKQPRFVEAVGYIRDKITQLEAT
jgi:NitT/TauT family transport system ATP-binding protein